MQEFNKKKSTIHSTIRFWHCFVTIYPYLCYIMRGCCKMSENTPEYWKRFPDLKPTSEGKSSDGLWLGELKLSIATSFFCFKNLLTTTIPLNLALFVHHEVMVIHSWQERHLILVSVKSFLWSECTLKNNKMQITK